MFLFTINYAINYSVLCSIITPRTFLPHHKDWGVRIKPDGAIILGPSPALCKGQNTYLLGEKGYNLTLRDGGF